MKSNALLLSLAVATALAGCSALESKKVDYKSQAKQVPALEVPPDLTSPSRDDRYSVPGVKTAQGYVAQSVAPQVLPDVGKIRVERSGNQRWLLVPESPEKLWPVVKDFWQEAGFIINVEQPEAGVMETDWAEDRAKIPQDFIRNAIGAVFDDVYSTSERDKYRTRLEKSATAGTTEIYISHRGMEEVYTNEAKDQTRWQPRQANPELEAEMLRRLMVRLGVDTNKAAEMTTATTPASEHAVLAAEGSTLVVKEVFERAWQRVGLALDRVGFSVEDRDRSKGIYYVQYLASDSDLGKKNDKGFLSSLAFWRSEEKTEDGRYAIVVKAGGEQTSVTVMNHEASSPASPTVAKKILGLLRDQLK